MFTMITQGTRQTFSAVAAVAIVSLGGVVMDQAHLAAAPEGTVEVGELTALGNTGIAQLPAVVVRARREPTTYLATAQLPEIVVVAKRVAAMVAKDEAAKRAPSPSINVGF